MDPSQLVAINISPWASQERSKIESSKRSCTTTSGRFSEVSQTEMERSREPIAQQGVRSTDESISERLPSGVRRQVGENRTQETDLRCPTKK